MKHGRGAGGAGNGRVHITQSGRSGTVTYHEGTNEVSFFWEFSGGEEVAVLTGPRADAFDASYPWAAGRQAEIFSFVGDEVARRQAPTCTASVDLDHGWITLRPQPGIVQRLLGRP